MLTSDANLVTSFGQVILFHPLLYLQENNVSLSYRIDLSTTEIIGRPEGGKGANYAGLGGSNPDHYPSPPPRRSAKKLQEATSMVTGSHGSHNTEQPGMAPKGRPAHLRCGQSVPGHSEERLLWLLLRATRRALKGR